MSHVAFPPDLVKRAKQGDDEAFLELFALTRIFVFRLSKSTFHLNLTDAEDLFQEVVFSFYRNLNQVQSPAAWIFTACKHALPKYEPSKHESWNDTHNDLLVDDSLEQQSMIWESVLKLSPHCKLIILRLLVEEYTEVEMARALSMSDRTVHAHKKRCVANLFRLYIGEVHA